MKKKLLIVGGHGSGEIAMSVFQDVNSVTGEWDIEGFLTDIKKPGEYLGSHNVIGSTEEVEYYVEKGYYIHYALFYNARQKQERVEKFKRYKIPLEANASAVHPRAFLGMDSSIGHGVIVGALAATSVSVNIGDFVHVYPGSYIAHETRVEDFCTITAHSVLGARNIIRLGAHIGLNATTREDIKIGEYAVVGIGSVVLGHVPPFTTVAGNPAKPVRPKQEKNKKFDKAEVLI